VFDLGSMIESLPAERLGVAALAGEVEDGHERRRGGTTSVERLRASSAACLMTAAVAWATRS
jgi:hypothetical protein